MPRPTSRSLASIRTLAIVGTLLCWLPVACQRGPGPQADRSRTPERIAAEAGEYDRERLEQVVADYERHILAREGELRELQEDIRTKAGDVIDAVLGTGPTDSVRAEVERLTDSVKAMSEEVRDLSVKLSIYRRELARRE
ncbi:MAG: YtxH domain-containing protein [Planctomycetota bacterium]|jgi:hypothetical protein